MTLASCGRLQFSELVDARDASVDSSPFACPAQPVPDPLTISGTTFRYTTYTNDRALLNAALVELVDGSGQIATSMTSNASGLYTLSVSPSIHPGPYSLMYSRTGFEDTNVFFDRAFTRDIQGAYQPIWTAGDGPLWSTIATDSVYETARMGYPRDPARGIVNVAVRDCADAPLAGVQVALDPPPGLMSYQADDGTPNTNLTTTTGTFAHALALNVPAGLVHVTASAPGLRFTDVYVNVVTGASTLTVIHGGP
jgi:hypothetical protein